MKAYMEKLFGRVACEKWHDPSPDDYDERRSVLIELLDAAAMLKDARDEAIRSAVHVEYCKKSGLYPRGYYCPDPLVDICVSNVSRGSIKLQVLNEPEFLYYFDQNNELSLVVSRGEGRRDRIVWNELLYPFNGIRVGIQFAEEFIRDSNDRGMYVRVETRSPDRSEYAISEYHVYCSWGCSAEVYGADHVCIVFENGLPVKQIWTDNKGSYDENEPPILKSVTEIKYNEKGFPCNMIWDGKPCRLGRVKKPNMAGMMK